MRPGYAGRWIEAVKGEPAGPLIARLRREGWSWRKIAAELKISPTQTVREHVRHGNTEAGEKERGQPVGR